MKILFKKLHELTRKAMLNYHWKFAFNQSDFNNCTPEILLYSVDFYALILSGYKNKKESGSCSSINLNLVLSPIAYSRPHITDLKGWTLRTHACDAKGDGLSELRA